MAAGSILPAHSSLRGVDCTTCAPAWNASADVSEQNRNRGWCGAAIVAVAAAIQGYRMNVHRRILRLEYGRALEEERARTRIEFRVPLSRNGKRTESL